MTLDEAVEIVKPINDVILLQARVATLARALSRVIEANDSFRKSLPDDWDGDPVNDACEIAREALSGLTPITR